MMIQQFSHKRSLLHVMMLSYVLSVIGFTGAGVAKHSLAAAVQSSIGNVAAGSGFATLTSIGASAGAATGCNIL